MQIIMDTMVILLAVVEQVQILVEQVILILENDVVEMVLMVV